MEQTKEVEKSNLVLENTKCILCGSDKAKIVAQGEDYEYRSIPGIFTFQECVNCGHLYLNPRPTIESASILYSSNYYTVTSDSKNTWKNQLVSWLARIIMLNRIRTLIKLLPKGGTALEVGCGDGIILEQIKQLRPDVTVIGVDLQISKSTRLSLTHQNILLYECAFENLSLQKESIDLIIMNQLIEHLWKLEECIAKIYHLLQPHGHVVIATPNASGYDRRLGKDGAWGGYYWPRHMNLFTPVSIEKLFKQYKLNLIRFRPLVFPVGWVHSLLYITERLNWKRLASFIKPSNPFLLAVFTTVDLFAILFGKQTSNMQLLFQKEK